MRYAVLLVLGVAIGWFARDLTFDKTEKRAERTDARREAQLPDREPAPRPEPAEAPATVANEPASPDPAPPAQAAPEEEGAVAKEGETEAEEDALIEMTKAMSKQWKGWATMQAKQKVQALLAELGFDAETSKLIEDAVVAEAERQVERAIAMMVGEEEMDADAFAYFMGLPPDLTPELERELATFLSDSEIGAVREGVKKAYDRQLNDMADMQITMMGIRDMTQDQERQVREVFAGKDFMKEQFTQFAEVTRDRGVMKKLISGEIDLAKEMQKSFEPRRQRMRQILNDAQFEKYKEYEQTLIKQAEMGIRMFSGMLKQKPEKK